jgi:coniferyl-aldehyde dehydrogenase
MSARPRGGSCEPPFRSNPTTARATITAVPSLREIFDRQRSEFSRCAPLKLEKRLEALSLLLQSIVNHQDELIEAVSADFGHRAATETRILELFPLIDEIRFLKRHLRRWMRPRRIAANWQFLPSRARIIYQPLGVAGVIGASNYPILLTLSPLANALAAGNHVIVKPSELAPKTANVIGRIVSTALPEEYVAVIIGDKEVASALCTLPFDHLLFTGSTATGKLVMRSAAENLTPVTLELGGKSPALVHESYSMATAADRICSAKFWNAGQTCVAPDYALVPAQKRDEFLSKCEEAVATRYSASSSSSDYTHMISQSAWDRMQELVDDAKSKGARVIQAGSSDRNIPPESRAFPPTLIVGADDSMRVMQEEIFGPILPVVAYSSFAEALSFINARPRPLALYYFDTNKSRTRTVLEQTTSGGVCINDCIFQFVQHRLPFGGVGPSGMGAYHGFDGFKAFSKKKGVFLQSSLGGLVLDKFFKPPYTPRTDRVIGFLLGRNTTRPIRKMTLP